MPRLTNSVPKYRIHRASGQAIVSLSGKDYYLGPHGTEVSHREYDRLIAEWIANGRRSIEKANDLTIVELCAAYWRFAENHYRRPLVGSSELDNIRYAVRPLKKLYGRTAVRDFGPKALKAIQQEMIRNGLSRSVINSRISKIKRVFRWAVSEDLAPRELAYALHAVPSLKKGRTEAREAPPIEPVSDERVEATLPFLPVVVADMVRIQRLVGCRPSELCDMRSCDIDRSTDVWKYSPAHHKTEHHGRQRIICIGPKAQLILQPYLEREPEAYCFSPVESENGRRKDLRARRKTRVQPSQIDRLKKHPNRRPGDRYSPSAYLTAIRRSCEKAFPEPEGLSETALKLWRHKNWWSPNRLRHATATEIRKRFGIEATQVVLGHSKADVTQIYAERDLLKAENIMKEIG